MKKIAYAAGLVSILNATLLSASPIDPALLIGTWHCSFESSSVEQSLVGTSVDTYFADGTSRSESNLSLQLHPFGVDVAYELTLEAAWQLIDGQILQETVTAVPKFLTTNPALEQLISLKAALLDGKAESAQVVELSATTAIFKTLGDQHTQHEVRCAR